MTEPNLYDLVVDELVERHRLVRAELVKRFKRTRPFRMEKISDEEMLNSYNNLTPEIMSDLINRYGRENVNEMIFTMEKLKAKRGQ